MQWRDDSLSPNFSLWVSVHRIHKIPLCSLGSSRKAFVFLSSLPRQLYRWTSHSADTRSCLKHCHVYIAQFSLYFCILCLLRKPDLPDSFVDVRAQASRPGNYLQKLLSFLLSSYICVCVCVCGKRRKGNKERVFMFETHFRTLYFSANLIIIFPLKTEFLQLCQHFDWYICDISVSFLLF